MPKPSKIRWKDSDKRALSNAVRSFNSKRTRLIKKVPELADFLPQKLSVIEIKEAISTRSEFNKQLKSIKRFLRPGAEKTVYTKGGIKTTKYEVNELRIKVATINRQRAKKLKEMAPSTEKGTMGSIRENNLRPKKFNLESMNEKAWKAFKETVEKQSKPSYWADKNKLYKKNYLEALKTEMSEHPKYHKLVDIVKKIPDDVLADEYYNNPLVQIDFVYGEEELNDRVEILIENLTALLPEQEEKKEEDL